MSGGHIDTPFLQLAEKWRLAFDREQWVVQKARKIKGHLQWHGIAFVGDRKAVLCRVLRENRAEVSESGERALKRLPDTFREFIVERQAETDAEATPIQRAA